MSNEKADWQSRSKQTTRNFATLPPPLHPPSGPRRHPAGRYASLPLPPPPPIASPKPHINLRMVLSDTVLRRTDAVGSIHARVPRTCPSTPARPVPAILVHTPLPPPKPSAVIASLFRPMIKGGLRWTTALALGVFNRSQARSLPLQNTESDAALLSSSGCESRSAAPSPEPAHPTPSSPAFSPASDSSSRCSTSSFASFNEAGRTSSVSSYCRSDGSTPSPSLTQTIAPRGGKAELDELDGVEGAYQLMLRRLIGSGAEIAPRWHDGGSPWSLEDEEIDDSGVTTPRPRHSTTPSCNATPIPSLCRFERAAMAAHRDDGNATPSRGAITTQSEDLLQERVAGLLGLLRAPSPIERSYSVDDGTSRLGRKRSASLTKSPRPRVLSSSDGVHGGWVSRLELVADTMLSGDDEDENASDD